MNETFSANTPSPSHPIPPLPTIYQVRLTGILDESWHEWFDDMNFSYDYSNNETLLTGTFPDQAALHGMLAKLRDFDLALVELRRVANQAPV